MSGCLSIYNTDVEHTNMESDLSVDIYAELRIVPTFSTQYIEVALGSTTDDAGC